MFNTNEQKLAQAVEMMSTITESLNKSVTANQKRAAQLDKREKSLKSREELTAMRERGVGEREKLVSAREKSISADITKSTTPTVTTDGRPDTYSVDVLSSEVAKSTAIMQMGGVGYVLQGESPLAGGQTRLNFAKTDVFAIPTNAMPGKWKV